MKMLAFLMTTQQRAALLVGFDDLPDDALVNPKCAAAFVDVEARTLANWRALGKGPDFIRDGGFVRYRVGDLKKWRQKRGKAA
jgi:hypothetical protein